MRDLAKAKDAIGIVKASAVAMLNKARNVCLDSEEKI
jgi:hypothetical protein